MDINAAKGRIIQIFSQPTPKRFKLIQEGILRETNGKTLTIRKNGEDKVIPFVGTGESEETISLITLQDGIVVWGEV